jgi:hypothetical protein
MSAVPTGLFFPFSHNPGTEVPGYYQRVPDGTRETFLQRSTLGGIRRVPYRFFLSTYATGILITLQYPGLEKPG